jgi:hypothetical protein
MTYYISNDYLAHHGVKGMHWGIRRYENKAYGDNRYTKKAVEKAKSSLAKYEGAKKAYNNAKASKNKAAIKTAKQQMREAKYNANSDYKDIKYSYRADQGRRLYRSGKTITDNGAKFARNQSVISMAALLSNAVLKNSGRYIVTKKCKAIPLNTIVTGGILGAGTLYNVIGSAKNSYENKRMRAYYTQGRR